MKKILILLIASIILISGCTQNSPSNYQDCGTSKSLLSNKTISQINFEEDTAMVCMGNNLLNNCRQSKSVLETRNIGQVKFEINGLSGTDCIIRVEYGNGEQIQDSVIKKFANKYIECPVSIETIISSYPHFKGTPGLNEEPGTLASIVYSALGNWALYPGNSGKCTGTIINS